MMRMAGSHYINRNGESQGQVQIINADGPRYSAEELDAVLPAPQRHHRHHNPSPKRGWAARQRRLPDIAEALDLIPRRKVGMEPTATTGSFGVCCRCAEAGYSDQVAVDSYGGAQSQQTKSGTSIRLAVQVVNRSLQDKLVHCRQHVKGS